MEAAFEPSFETIGFWWLGKAMSDAFEVIGTKTFPGALGEPAGPVDVSAHARIGRRINAAATGNEVFIVPDFLADQSPE
jgi:hypothetical protein